MDTRKVVGTWESDNGATAPGRLRNGKGVIPLLPHELPPQLQPSSFTTIGTANAVTSSTTTTTTATTHHTNTVVSSTYPKYLSLFHEVMRGHYRSIWGLIDSRAPYPLLVVSTSTPADVQQQPMSLKDDATPPVSTSSSTTTSPFRAYKLTPSKVCLLYTSDAADEEDSVDLGGRRIIKKKKKGKKENRQVRISHRDNSKYTYALYYRRL
eukprot:TRINITY_DN64790_c0_g1_i2.p1 TRINITY_DN64790_c0_g1~~TRINITY_DN64790_c0_g1_i2.p1  ORF type:complete len:210 (-),score=32.86 TRINITY_DN64790_c0_g1_i2:33-662(-)